MSESAPQAMNHYALLGLKPGASVQAIRQAYRDLSKLYHPDTTTLPAAIATDKFQQLNEAYATLSNPERRLAYDHKIGYSRIAVMQSRLDLNQPVSRHQGNRDSRDRSAYLDPTDRPLSAGEMFALFILGVTFAACLVLVVTIGLTQGEVAFGPLMPPDLTISPPPVDYPVDYPIEPPIEGAIENPSQSDTVSDFPETKAVPVSSPDAQPATTAPDPTTPWASQTNAANQATTLTVDESSPPLGAVLNSQPLDKEELHPSTPVEALESESQAVQTPVLSTDNMPQPLSSESNVDNYPDT